MPLSRSPNIEELKAKRDINGLIETLGYLSDAALRRAGGEALGILGDARAVEPLMMALKDSDKDVRAAAAEALGKLGDRRAAEPLVSTLIYDVYPAVRTAAAKTLGKLGDALAVEPLITGLKDSDKDVRKAAAEALCKVRDKRATEPLLATFTYDVYQDVREAAIDTLGEIGDVRAVEPLIPALKDPHVSVRAAAAEALGKLGDRRAVEPLLLALKDSNVAVCTAAVEALGKLGDMQSVEPLLTALKSSKSRLGTVAALGKLGEAPPIAPLITDLKHSNLTVPPAADETLPASTDAFNNYRLHIPLGKTVASTITSDELGDTQTRGNIGTVRVARDQPNPKSRIAQARRSAGKVRQKLADSGVNLKTVLGIIGILALIFGPCTLVRALITDSGIAVRILAGIGLLIYYFVLFCIPFVMNLSQQFSAAMDTPEMWRAKGIDSYEASDYPKAIEYFQEAIKRNPEYEDAWYSLGLTFDQLGQYDLALQYYDRAIELKPTHANAWCNKGVILFKRGKIKEAVECYQTAERYGSIEAKHNLESNRR